MKIGLFFNPCSRSVLVVIDYEKWTEQITKAGFPEKPAIVRPATTPEVVALEECGDTFPAWRYNDLDELLDDEEKSGGSRAYLQALLQLVLRFPDRTPEPQRASQA